MDKNKNNKSIGIKAFSFMMACTLSNWFEKADIKSTIRSMFERNLKQEFEYIA